MSLGRFFQTPASPVVPPCASACNWRQVSGVRSIPLRRVWIQSKARRYPTISSSGRSLGGASPRTSGCSRSRATVTPSMRFEDSALSTSANSRIVSRICGDRCSQSRCRPLASARASSIQTTPWMSLRFCSPVPRKDIISVLLLPLVRGSRAASPSTRRPASMVRFPDEDSGAAGVYPRPH